MSHYARAETIKSNLEDSALRPRETHDSWASLTDLIASRLQARAVVIAGDNAGSLAQSLQARQVDARCFPSLQKTATDLTVVLCSPSASVKQLLTLSPRILLVADALPQGARTDFLIDLASRGFFRTSFEALANGAILLERTSSIEAVRRYERWTERLLREVDVFQFLGVEYREELARREFEIARLAAEELAAPPRSPIHAVLQDVLQLRSRFAPSDSWRMHALDLSLASLHEAASKTLRLFDSRDMWLQRSRNWTMKIRRIAGMAKT